MAEGGLKLAESDLARAQDAVESTKDRLTGIKKVSRGNAADVAVEFTYEDFVTDDTCASSHPVRRGAGPDQAENAPRTHQVEDPQGAPVRSREVPCRRATKGGRLGYMARGPIGSTLESRSWRCSGDCDRHVLCASWLAHYLSMRRSALSSRSSRKTQRPTQSAPRRSQICKASSKALSVRLNPSLQGPASIG